jgi:hypothetical protein
MPGNTNKIKSIGLRNSPRPQNGFDQNEYFSLIPGGIGTQVTVKTGPAIPNEMAET